MFDKIVNNQNLLNAGQEDIIFPVYSKLITNHIILRGTLEKITICIYGVPCNNQETILLIENARNEINLEKLK